MPIPVGPHDSARQVELDLVDAVLHLVANRPDEAVRPIAFQGVARGEEVPAGRREEMTAGVDARTDVLARVERALPGDVHEAVRAGATNPGDPRLGQRLHQAMPEQGHLLGQRQLARGVEIGMDVDVPQAG